METELTDLGEHRFKDLSAPERVFQLGARGFPALKSLYRTNLPVPATTFLGREHELAEVVVLLERQAARLVTLTGPGGTGKTRLALQAAAEASDGFPDGVFWIPLALLRDASLLGTTFAQSLDVSEQPGVAIADSLVGAFAAKRAAVVIDNCDHLVDAVADLVRRLIEGCQKLVIVASSRERLGLRAERVYAVPPMAPTDGELLFLERARAVDSGFEPDEHVGAICEAVDGLPLAIELAAARVRSLSTQAIRERLAERLSLLSTRDRDVEERQRTLEATTAWSYDLLRAEEQRVLRALSVFAGGCTLDAAEAVAGADLDLLESLLDKSLIRHRIDEAGQDRYWMLETIREFAASRLLDAGESTEVLRGHSLWYLALAQHAEPDFRSPEKQDWFERLDPELANFRAVLERSLGANDVLIELPGLLWRFWAGRDQIVEGQKWLEAALEVQGGEPTSAREKLLAGAIWMAYERGDYATARRHAEERLSVAHHLNDALAAARSLTMLGAIAAEFGEIEQAVSLSEEAVAMCREHGPTSASLWMMIHNLGVVWERSGNGDRARAAFAQALAAAQAAGDIDQVAVNHHSWAGAALLDRRYDEARVHLAEAYRLWMDFRVAQHFLDNALVMSAVIAEADGRTEDSARILAAVAHRAEETGRILAPQHQQRFESVLATLDGKLEANRLAGAWADGRAMSIEDAVELALSLESLGSESAASDLSLQDSPPM